MAFKNRIVDYGVKPADQFTANPSNPRVHPQFQREVMQAALNGIGFIAPVIENKRTGYLIDGHERVMQALTHNDPVPYVVVDLAEDEEAEALAIFDPIGDLASYDLDALDSLLASVDIQDDATHQMLDELLFDAEHRAEFMSASGSDGRKLGDNAKQVKIVLYVDQVLELEKAIAATELPNRGEAVIEICRVYLDEKRQHGLQ